MKKKHVALIGYGYWGQKIYKYLRESEDFLVRYVFFRGLTSLGNVAINQKYGSEFVPKIDLILNDESVPNVIIATPIKSHYTLTKQALMKSKNVLVEKPITTDYIQCRNLIKLAQERQVILETEYTYTYSDALSRAQKIIEEGKIGEIKSIILTKKQLGRFLSYDVYTLLGPHCVSILDMFLSVKDCRFSTKPLMSNKGLTTAAIIYFKSEKRDCQGYIDISLHCPTRETTVTIYGEHGTITYDPDSEETLSLTCYSRTQDKGTNQVKILNKEVDIFNEKHNLKLALNHFSEIIGKNKPDNSKRADCVTEAISAFSE